MSSPTYFYDTQVHWNGQRRGSLRASGLPELAMSTPPEFKGEPGLWTPEHLFVAAAEFCLMATFIGISEISKLAVAGYRSKARGRLDKPEGKGLMFTEIVISPVVELDRLEDIPQAQRVMAKAENSCLVANSMLTHVRVEPTFVEKVAVAA